MSIIPQKQCKRCSRILPYTNEYFGITNSNPAGLNYYCKECVRGIATERRLKEGNKPYLRSAKEGFKVCTKCNQELPVTPEYFNKHAKCYLGVKSVCRNCEKSNRETPEYKDRKNANGRKRYAQDPIKAAAYNRAIRLKNPERARESRKKWEINNPDYVRKAAIIKATARKMKMLKLPHSFTVQQWNDCLIYWGYKCCVCGRGYDLWHTIAQEHWIAISDQRSENPGTVVWNILPMCHSTKGAIGDVGCNNSKQNYDPIEWITRKLGKRKASKKLKEIKSYFNSVKGNS